VSEDVDVVELQRQVRHLLDRAEILDCIAGHARACDRHDADLLAGCYHDDGVDEHGSVVTAGPAYPAFINPVHAATSTAHTHNVTTHTCEIAGDTAHCDSYVLVVLLGTDGCTASIISGRYVDRLERRDGTWRIAVRRSTVEAMVTADASVLQSRFFVQQGYARGTRDRTDLSYERPLRIDTPAPARW
jgi:hypothetical protein